MKIGCHLSSSGGYVATAQTAASIGANVFQFFTRNPRGGAARARDKADEAAFVRFAAERGIGPALAHAPYTLNAAGADGRVRDFAFSVMLDDLRRLDAIPGAMYNFHPGAHVGQGAGEGVRLVADLLGRVFEAFGGVPGTKVLFETMAGKGTELGRDFAEVRRLIDAAEEAAGVKGVFGVCLDTCHVWDAGYDVAGDLDGVLAAFGREVGLERLYAVHLNDSMNARGSRKDRHEKIGRGKIGLDAFRRIVNHPALKDKPFYLETPCDLQGYKEEIALLKGLAEE